MGKIYRNQRHAKRASWADLPPAETVPKKYRWAAIGVVLTLMAVAAIVALAAGTSGSQVRAAVAMLLLLPGLLLSVAANLVMRRYLGRPVSARQRARLAEKTTRDWQAAMRRGAMARAAGLGVLLLAVIALLLLRWLDS